MDRPPRGRARLLIAWLRQREPRVLLAVLAAVLGVALFLALGELARDESGSGTPFDRWAITVLRDADDPRVPRGPHWLPEVARDLTALGSHVVVILVVGSVAGYLALRRSWRNTTLVLLAGGGGMALNGLLKHWIAHPRPAEVPHLATVVSSSFPSGHALLSALVYTSIAALLAGIEPRPLIKAYLMAVGLGIAALVGFTRVYLGVHYPSDVLAGWVAGLVWGMACWLLLRWLQARGGRARSTDG